MTPATCDRDGRIAVREERARERESEKELGAFRFRRDGRRSVSSPPPHTHTAANPAIALPFSPASTRNAPATIMKNSEESGLTPTVAIAWTPLPT
eukprot:scaffold6097_cov32-Tisochrysis_lutea.AAC.1